uniref:PNO1 second type I KH domain-containing protein n=1 Tax=Corethron hystrix TaxID=216773 RepID=A0A7S1FWS8_9STRA|mmetsp:Transcript_33879/g.78237  ORF Transcript_33879/g.78237 Transcript_33879/m.78237 type:complete len:245 (+) Transcript_33879:111-845(+)|eukprot:CAMPEP_0113297258 /NCGR_PEP_ID=MMETSP0010_2-20120614/198_1 /TAXON_ID=216773 ORGANISM="Corethron hystrix, Strain 308" /NCGR_SAMPLE_ID=MMETSP0010_2 /ASSEMBLY_ACC=CAM_ASM_000155 /LENGTH=244 /DNA_ID=CAMNT_0000150123 /DNA_START=111 /DNA_END=845 /DNA_ORIENTATION=+ /assembly_acc=CAM_ASM_000155
MTSDDQMQIDDTPMDLNPSNPGSRVLLSSSIVSTSACDSDAVDDNLPSFAPLSHTSAPDGSGGRVTEYRRIRCPAHRLTPLRNDWDLILTPLINYLHLQVRFNTKTRSVELKSGGNTELGSIQKGCDFVTAYMMGFEVADAVALLRLEDLFVESFNVTDVKMLRGDHLSRAIGRLAGQDGKTRFAIENATRTRIIIADQRIHMLGSYANIRVARNAICALILGAPPGKVYNNMRNVAKRMSERY